MPAPPPPPPPGPPPPPSFGGGASKSGGADGRGLLLQSIRQGTTLKKTVTCDRSAPQISGKLGNSAKSSNTNTSGNVRPSNSSSDAFRNNGLGGLFAGGMPKLKPTGRLGSNISPQTPDQVRHVPNSSSLHSESILQRQDSDSRSFPSDVRNRGPPPQPPPSTQKPSMPTSASDSILQTSITRFNSNTSPASGPPSLPSKPPVANFGKPNVAPKPPGKPSPPPKKLVMNGGRPTVTRAQSMRVPRSPPVAPPSVIFPPSSKELGSYQRNTAFHQSQDSIHQYRPNPPPPPRTATLPSNLHHHGFKSMAPLPPPSTPPPPAPTGQQMRPLNRPLRPRLGAPLCPPPPPPTSAPPPPPHRTSPAPAPPSMQTRLAPAVPSSAPPPPPVRNSSMRNGSSSGCSDIETRFAHMFHPVHEFPNPPTFRGITKIYNSKTAALKHHATNTGKQQAPPPPPVLQISNKMWANETSTC